MCSETREFRGRVPSWLMAQRSCCCSRINGIEKKELLALSLSLS
jgi:hypothetical protein